MERSSITFLFLVIALSSTFGIGYGQNGTFDVRDFGATGNGLNDDSRAFLEAWQRACGAVGEIQTLNIPIGRKYMVKPVQFDGPCNSKNIVIQVDGSIEAPSTIGEWTGCELGSWLGFQNVKGLTIKGAGVIDGKGSIWWRQKPQITNYTTGTNFAAPAALRFRYCDELALSGFTSLNSPNKHIMIHGSNGVDISSVHVYAPEYSPNTDGIVLYGSMRVNIFNSVIKTGDDCIALKSGCSFVNISRVACGPGHGISVGSLGRHPNDRVEEVSVRNVVFYGTQNGARIKTFRGGCNGYIRGISFSNIRLVQTRNPIIIDQYYFSRWHAGNGEIKVSDITFRGFRGTSASNEAIILKCSNLWCTNIVMDHVNISSMIPGRPTYSYCENANGRSSFTTPDVPCLKKQ
ncbi:hypothetical protein ACLB2K_010200 [Fragaria x ananassa]